MAVVCRKIQIFGRVQGVFFRASAKERADELGLSGYVRNLADGSVEVIVQDEKGVVDSFVEWLKNNPALSRVENIKTEDLPLQDFKGFEIKYRVL